METDKQSRTANWMGHSAVLINQGNNPKREALCLFGLWYRNNCSYKTYFIDTYNIYIYIYIFNFRMYKYTVILSNIHIE